MQVEFYLAGEITQVIDSIPWVRCASGNVCLIEPLIEEETQRAVEGITDQEVRSEESSCGISASILSSRSYAPPLLVTSTAAAKA